MVILSVIEAIAVSTSLAVPIPSDTAKDFSPVDTHERVTSDQGGQVSVVDPSVVPWNRGRQAQIPLKKLGHTLGWVECLWYPDF